MYLKISTVNLFIAQVKCLLGKSPLMYLYLFITLFVSSLLPPLAITSLAKAPISSRNAKLNDFTKEFDSCLRVNKMFGSEPRTVPASDSLALVDLYNSTDGKNWGDKANWLTGKVNTWSGVRVEDGRVTAIFFIYNRLSGPLPSSLGNLTALRILWIEENQLSGNIPASLGNLTALEWLVLIENQLSGSIPASLGKLAALKILALYNNQLSGSVPASLGNLTAVENFNLSNNQLSGSLPASLGNLTAVSNISMCNNQLSGNIPDELTNLRALKSLWLFGNQLTGSIPASLGKMTALENLNLNNNQLSGSIPSELGNMSALEWLDLSGNQLSGNIPSELGNLTALKNLTLSNNQLSGGIPTSLGNLTTLGVLFLNKNQLSGSIPASLGKLAFAYFIDLSENQLSGSIPNELGSLTALKTLYLSKNQLSGTPASLANLASLQTLFLDNNQFTSLPTFTASLSEQVKVSYNQLTFESLESNIGKFESFVYYSPQDSIGIAENQILPDGQSLILSVFVGGANNHYQWTKNGVDIAGANQASLTVTTIGGYSCKITNTLVPDLTLYRRQVNVRQKQTLTFASVPDKTYGDASFTLGATASSGLVVTYISSNPAVATVAGNTVTIIGAGSVTIKAQAGNAQYELVAVEHSFTVNKAAQVISFAALIDKLSIDAPFALSAHSNSGLGITYTIVSGSATLVGNTVTIKGSGKVSIKASQEGNMNYLAAISVEQSFMVNTVLGLEKLLHLSLNIYPVPATSFLTLEIPQEFTKGYLKLINLQGQSVIQQPLQRSGLVKLDVGQLKRGVYILSLQDDKAQHYSRVVLE